jgi:hypothetical protein
MGVLVHTARAHHEATGGPNPSWAEWYAHHAVAEINELLDRRMSEPELAEWLAAADRRYLAEQPEQSWPRAYATWLMEGASTGRAEE